MIHVVQVGRSIFYADMFPWGSPGLVVKDNCDATALKDRLDTIRHIADFVVSMALKQLSKVSGSDQISIIPFHTLTTLDN